MNHTPVSLRGTDRQGDRLPHDLAGRLPQNAAGYSAAGMPIATFSIAARDPLTGDLGVAVASKFLAVGAYVPTARAGVGAVASQAYGNTSYGPRAMAMLGAGASPADCAAEFEASDPGIQTRQFGIVGADGVGLTFTGSACTAWAGGLAGENFAAQGNILTGEDVVTAMVEVFHDDSLPFPERLVACLVAADARGGDRRGHQSAALLVVGEAKGYGGFSDRWIDLRVDDHEQPMTELGRLLELHRVFFDRPSGVPRPLSQADVTSLQDLLRREGYLDREPTGVWDDATESALENLFGVENLEERWLTGPRMDPVAWAHLQRRLRP